MKIEYSEPVEQIETDGKKAYTSLGTDFLAMQAETPEDIKVIDGILTLLLQHRAEKAKPKRYVLTPVKEVENNG